MSSQTEKEVQMAIHKWENLHNFIRYQESAN